VLARSSISECPLHCNLNRGQETPWGTVCNSERSCKLSFDLVGHSVREATPSPNVGRRLTPLGDPSIWIRLCWLNISFRKSGKGKI
jgi:hypothetical protein